jgi:hypothetical protein
MKAKKAFKRLGRIEALLGDVIAEFPGSKASLGELLNSAKDAVVRAKDAVQAQLKESPLRPARQGRLTPAGRKSISLAAKKRWAAAKRRGMNAVTGRRLSKMA